jgi:poly-gamma-glutamate synthesis protein (capsule biosynthesis protein)
MLAFGKKGLELPSYMSSKLKYLLISIAVSLIVLCLSFLISCTGQIASESPELDELEIVMVAVGDVMLSRQVGERIRIEDDPRAPFLRTAGILEKADITFCNLESPFYDEESLSEEWMVFGAEPAAIEGLKYAGFDVVSLANNHFGDQGLAGMNFTFSHLNKHEIQFIGAGENEVEAREPRIIERNGVKFAFLA